LCGHWRATCHFHMLLERAAFVVIKISHMLINLSFTTQPLGLCALARLRRTFLHRKT
jgi:hypothetical protein